MIIHGAAVLFRTLGQHIAGIQRLLLNGYQHECPFFDVSRSAGPCFSSPRLSADQILQGHLLLASQQHRHCAKLSS